MLFHGKYDSPMGPLLLLSDGTALTGLYMGRDIPEKSDELPVFRKAEAWLTDYFRGVEREIDFPLNPAGTAFQKQIWDILLTIPFGTARTYGDIAKQLAVNMGKEKMSAQAIGQAVGRNPINIIIPCHRVVGTEGKLTGYTGGMENKIWLLRHEGWTIEKDRAKQARENQTCDT